MVRTTNIRDKLRSNALKELARERSSKRPRIENNDSDNDDDDGESNTLEEERKQAKLRRTNNSLLSILPEPKNSSSFGPTVRLEKLLKLPERAEQCDEHERSETQIGAQADDDGVIEVDVSKFVSDITPSLVKDLTVEKSKPIVVPKGKEKQKNQITYLAQLGKANELERKEQAAASRMNKAAARSKYGW